MSKASKASRHPEILLVSGDRHQISCDGGGTLGHPRVYYSFDGQDRVTCGYCDRLFTKTNMPGAKPYKALA